MPKGLGYKLKAVPEMGLDPHGTPPKGELFVKSKGLFNGYYKDDTASSKVLDSEGYYATGTSKASFDSNSNPIYTCHLP